MHFFTNRIDFVNSVNEKSIITKFTKVFVLTSYRFVDPIEKEIGSIRHLTGDAVIALPVK